MPLPKIVCSSVIRAANRGDSHGGIYAVDLESGKYDLLLDWDRPDIDWDGRGGDRGIRGMAFYKNELYAAAGDEVFAFNRDMEVVKSFRSRWLKHTHEVALDKARGLLYVIANIYDTILVLDCNNDRWRGAFVLPKEAEQGDKARWIDAYAGTPERTDHIHLDSVFLRGRRLYYCGAHITTLNYIDLKDMSLHVYATELNHTHNARPCPMGVLYNLAYGHKTVYADNAGKRIREWPTPWYKKEDMTHTDMPHEHAVQGYTRGMVVDGGRIIVGSSPATIYVFRHGMSEPEKRVQLSNDIRNSVCGIARWGW